MEMRIAYGPGYRFYYVHRGAEIMILLCGGDKRTQQLANKQQKLATKQAELTTKTDKAQQKVDKKAQKDLQNLFGSANALRVKFQCAGDPVVTANAATWNCTQSMTITQSGKRQAPIDRPVSVGFKKGNGWVVDWVRGR